MNDNNPGADRSPEQLEARAKARELRRAQRRSRASRHDPGADEPGDGTEGYAPSASGAAATPVRPPAQPARLKKRHLGVGLGMVLMVLVPLLATTVYLYVFAQDQYASNTGFTVRSEETSSATELAGGLTALVGGSNSSNADVLYAYIQSQQIVERIQEQLDIRAHFSENWGIDPVFSIWPDASIEDLLWFWGRIMRVSYDQASGLMDVQIRANSAEYAQELARLVVHESEEMINQLNAQARRDSMANANLDLDAALERLRSAREELASFRVRTQIVDPQADIQGRMGVINNLQQQLAQALVDHDLLLQTTAENDPRMRQAERRIEVIQDRIASERLNFATQDVTVFDTDYPRLIAQYESLIVNQEFAERTYTAALTALDSARSNVERQNLYLATYVRPTLAQSAEYPQRILLVALAAIFLTLTWAATTLIYYSLRDRG